LEKKISYNASKILPDKSMEKLYLTKGYDFIAGVDEVGRGCIAGPVVAGAAIMNVIKSDKWHTEIRDSKQLSKKKRESLAPIILTNALYVGIGSISEQIIDKVGIIQSTIMAMESAIEKLCQVDFILVDAISVNFKTPSESIVHGDAKIFSIACASIIAKVFRDEIMNEFELIYPGYNFAQNKGYPTKEHLKALKTLGLSPIHRRTFGPVKTMLN
jgi:ribonuclease HII